MNTTLRAFHGDPKIKAKYIRRVRAHRKADQLIQGTGWENGKGCAVGCTLRVYDHSLYPVELGIPVIMAGLEDAIFEGLPKADAQAWPERFLGAIKPGANLDNAWSRFALWLLEDKLGAYPTSATVAALYRRQLAGEMVGCEEWHAAANATYATYAAYAANVANAAANATYAAYAAAANATYAAYAANARAAYAANAAAWAANAATYAIYAANNVANAANGAAARAAFTTAWAVNRVDFWDEASNKLIEILKDSR